METVRTLRGENVCPKYFYDFGFYRYNKFLVIPLGTNAGNEKTSKIKIARSKISRFLKNCI